MPETIQVPVDYPLTVVPVIAGFRVVTYAGSTECIVAGAPRFDTEAEGRAFILGVEWALEDKVPEV